MPIAAVPAYLGQDFKDASPGLRFGMYLAIWTDRHDQEREVGKRAEARSLEGQELAAMLQEHGMEATIAALRQRERNRLPGLWEKNDHAARKAWEGVRKLSQDDRARLQALVNRQQVCADQAQGFTLEAQAIAPFTTGLGNEHPLENGFAFLWPYGLPYLPGSGVKGVVRRAAEELAEGMWGDKKGWSKDPAYPLLRRKSNGEFEGVKDDRKEPIQLSVLDVLFGREPPSGDSHAVRGALAFWDVIPLIAGDSLMVEVMTPHQGHYYQQKQDRRSGDSTTPHDSGQPVPICFLTVPPGSQFSFHVVCDVAHLERLTAHKLEGAPDLLATHDGRPLWQHLLQAAFEQAFEWLGFGAKTAVGYGSLETPAMREQRQAEPAAQLAAAPATPAREAEVWHKARINWNRANGALTVTKGSKSATALSPASETLLASLPENLRQKIKTNQFVQVTAHVSGGTLVRIEP